MVRTNTLGAALLLAFHATVAGIISAPVASADIVIGRGIPPYELHLRAGLDALKRKDLTAAEKAFTESLAVATPADKTAAPLLGLAQVAMARGDRAALERHFQQVLAVAADRSDVQTLWGRHLHSVGRFAEAEAAFRRATRDAAAFEPRMHLGDLYLTALRRPLDAAASYRAAIAIDPRRPGAHYGLGLALGATRQHAEAEKQLIEATRLAPSNPLAYHALGRLYLEQKRTELAFDTFGRALKAFPGFPAAHLEQGKILMGRGADTDALDAFERAAQADPKLAEPLVRIGMVHQRSRRWTEAEAAYRAALKLDDRLAVVYNNLAWMAVERGAPSPEAIALARRATSLAPAVPEFRTTLNRLLGK
jgi:Tfp pilus assembly protein PilF